MKPKSIPTSPKTREEQRALAALYDVSTVSPPPPTQLGRTLVLAAVVGLVVAAGGLAGLAALTRRLPADSWVRRFVPEARPTVIVREGERAPATLPLSQRLGDVGPVVVAVFSGLAVDSETASDPPTPDQFRGNAVLVASTGIALTTADVVAQPGGPFAVLTRDQRLVAVRRVTLDPASPFAILTLEGQDFPAAKFAPQEALTPGLEVAVVGAAGSTPFVPSIVSSHVSAIGLRAGTGRAALVESSERLDRAFALDRAGAPAGSPVVTARGEVLGLTRGEAQAGQQSVAPLWHVQPALRLVLRGSDLVRPLLGARYIDISRIPPPAAAGGVTAGALVAAPERGTPAVAARSPAAAGGLADGDVIVEVHGVVLDVTASLGEVIQDLSPGQTIRVRYRRRGTERTVEVTLGALRA